MSISLQEELIFSKWRICCPQFVSDGVIEENCYIVSQPRILFIFKEASLSNGNLDLREVLRSGFRSETWDNITRWVEGIRNISEDISWFKLVSMTVERRREVLRTIAVMNLQKSLLIEDPKKNSLINKEYWNQQFSLYEADIIVCCGTDVKHVVHRLVNILRNPKWQVTSRGISYHEYLPNKHLIAYVHPEARVANNLLYYGIVDAVREIRRKYL